MYKESFVSFFIPFCNLQQQQKNTIELVDVIFK